MVRKKRKRIEELLPVLGLAVLYILQFVAHRCVPFMMDDEWYSTNLVTGGPLRSFGDVLEGQVWHYLNWGGRSVTHGILQLTLMSGELCADILNIGMTLLLAYLICVVAGQKKISCFLLSSSLLVAFNANAKMSMFWQAGLVNYVYSSVWILLFLWIYLRTADAPEDESLLFVKGVKRALITIGMLPLGLISGWSNENMGPTCFLLAAAVIGYRLWLKKPVPLWMYVGALAGFAGSILVILAPGNFVRSATIETQSLGKMLYLRFFSMYEAGIAFLFPIVMLLAVFLIIYLVVLGKRLCAGQVLLLAGMMLSYGAMVLSPHYPDRATFGTMVLGLAVVCSLIQQIKECRPEFGKYVRLLQMSVWLYSLSVLLQMICEKLG